MNQKVYSHNIYRLYEPYDEDAPKYCCMRPVETGNYGIFDAWICDTKGRVHPGYAASPVPIKQGSFDPEPL